MSAWHDRVVDLTHFEALTGGAFKRQNGNIAGNLTKIFQNSQMPRGLPGGGGMGGFGIDRYIICEDVVLCEMSREKLHRLKLDKLKAICAPFGIDTHFSKKKIHYVDKLLEYMQSCECRI